MDMSLDTALNNITNVVRAFIGNAEQHELLAASLAVIRQRLALCQELEAAAQPKPESEAAN